MVVLWGEVGWLDEERVVSRRALKQAGSRADHLMLLGRVNQHLRMMLVDHHLRVLRRANGHLVHRRRLLDEVRA